MKYDHIQTGIFMSRPNRFLAHVELEGKMAVCHVKNTGRCKELLIPGVTVLVQHHPDALNQGRKTEYSLIGVYKETKEGTVLINMDSQAPNQVAAEWLKKKEEISDVKREVTYGASRFDLAFAVNGKPAFMEVKGVTLEKEGVAMFPDAPTQRGIKHLHELSEATCHGYEAYVLFVIQMKGVTRFTPNMETHPEFGQALKEASAAGVHILAYDCVVTENGLEIDQPVLVDI